MDFFADVFSFVILGCAALMAILVTFLAFHKALTNFGVL